MARGATFAAIGITALHKDLAGVRDDIRQELAPIVASTAGFIARRAAVLAPRDRGDLAAAIQAQGRGLSWRVGIVDTAIPARGGDNTAHLNPWVYGVWYELGFVTREIPAHPYMRPAADAADPIFNAQVDALLARVVG